MVFLSRLPSTRCQHELELISLSVPSVRVGWSRGFSCLPLRAVLRLFLSSLRLLRVLVSPLEGSTGQRVGVQGLDTRVSPKHSLRVERARVLYVKNRFSLVSVFMHIFVTKGFNFYRVDCLIFLFLDLETWWII